MPDSTRERALMLAILTTVILGTLVILGVAQL